MRRHSFVPAAFMCLAALALLTQPLQAVAQSTDDLAAIITSPVDGQQLFGQINIVGSAAHTTAFASYTLEYDDLSDPAQQWFLIQERVTQQIRDGVLGAWNTNLVPDGIYQLRLRVFLTDGQVADYIVSNLHVLNSEPTPVPTVASELGGAAPDEPIPGPSPTSSIQQPPSANPITSDVVGLQDPGSDTDDTAGERINKPQKQINIARVRRAFCSGAYLTFGLFAVLLVYRALQGRVRPFTRRALWQAQDELNQDR